jgi:DNA ligase-1
MRDFVLLYAALDQTNATNEKVAILADYFARAKPADAAWATFFLTGRRLPSVVKRPMLKAWAREQAGLPEWLFDECYGAVADLAETLAAVLPEPASAADDRSLADWVEDVLLPLAGRSPEDQRATVLQAWNGLDRLGRLVFNKLMTGALRVGISHALVVRAIARASGVDEAIVGRRLMGEWSPSARFFELLASPSEVADDAGRPYPFALAHALEQSPESLGDPGEWIAEWKWDGIRAQAIRRPGATLLWSRGEGVLDEAFPDVWRTIAAMDVCAVLDGEIVVWDGDAPAPFSQLQRRLNRKAPGPKLLTEAPCRFIAFDLLELAGEDWRGRPLRERRLALESLVDAHIPGVSPSPRIRFAGWPDLAAARDEAPLRRAEGVMLKRADAPYPHGRQRGLWWKWKVAPFTVDAVLVYAQRGSGKRASLYTDYTFALWDDDRLVPFAKAYSGLTDSEIREVDAFVRRSTQERFGPVRTVAPELVFEIAFEGIQISSRHKSGIAVRFPRILRWRRDKRAAEADRLETVRALLGEARR